MAALLVLVQNAQTEINSGQQHPRLRIYVSNSPLKSDLRLLWRGCNVALIAVFLDRPNENVLIYEQVARDFAAIFADYLLAAYDFLVAVKRSRRQVSTFARILVSTRNSVPARVQIKLRTLGYARHDKTGHSV
jgi:hypothetical protein